MLIEMTDVFQENKEGKQNNVTKYLLSVYHIAGALLGAKELKICSISISSASKY